MSLCYGIKYDEGHVFPWGAHRLMLEGWWTKMHGQSPIPITLVDYFEPIRDIYARLGIEESCNGKAYILTVSESIVMSYEWSPSQLDPSALVLFQHDWREKLMRFCNEHSIDKANGPQWWTW